MVEFKTTKEESALISKIADRAVEQGIATKKQRIDVIMDLEACHSNGCPLDLQKLLDFPNFDFNHDIGGINRHLDRENGKLKNCFCPRCAKHEASE